MRRFVSTALAVVVAVTTLNQPAAAQEATRAQVVGWFKEAEKLRIAGDYAKAVPLYQRALREAPRVFGEGSVNHALCINNLASVLSDLGRYAEAEPLYKQNLAIDEARQGKDHPDTAISLNNLALLYANTARYAEAKSLYERALAINEARLGKDHPKTALALNNLASLNDSLGRYAEAEPLYQRSLAIREGALGPGHADVAQSLNNLAWLYNKMGRYAHAEPLLKRSLAIYEDKLGKDHPSTANAVNNLALVYKATARYTEAEPLYKRSLAIREARLGASHHRTAASVSNLASLYSDTGRYAEAEPLYKRSLAICEAQLGPDHPVTANALNSLALLYQNRGRCDEAEPLYRRSLAIREARLGKDHPDTAIVVNNLAFLANSRGRPADAEPYYKRSLAISEAKNGKDHPYTALALSNLGNLYRTTGRVAAAEPLAQRALDIRRARLGKGHPDTIAAQFELAILRWLDGRHAEAVRLTHQTLQLDRAHQVKTLPSLSEPDQLNYLHQTAYLDRALTVAVAEPLEAENAARTAAWLVNGKAVAQQAVAERLLLARAATSDKARKQVADLTAVRQELVTLTLNPGGRNAAEAARRKDELTEKERLLSAELHQHDDRASREDPWIDLDQLTRRLPPGAVYVDFVRFKPVGFRTADKDQAARYAAWVTTAKGTVRVVDLGEAAAIDSLVADARKALEQSVEKLKEKGEPDAEAIVRRPLQWLADRVLKPLRAQLDAADGWVICPDGQLWLVPWAALPLDDKTYAVEKHPIRLVVSGRDLVLDPLRLDLKAGPPLVLADPDFDAVPAGAGLALSGTSGPGRIGDWQVTFEFAAGGVMRVRDPANGGKVAGEGTWAVADDGLILKTAVATFTGRRDGAAVRGDRVRRNDDGTTTRDRWEVRLPDAPAAGPTRQLLKDLPEQRGVVGGLKFGRVERLPGTAVEAAAVAEHMAAAFGKPRVLTDGNAVTAAVRAAVSPSVLVLATHGFFLPEPKSDDKARAAENPLLRCGLLLAGCNHAREAKEGQDTGVLTGLDVVGLDLRGTKQVVLSACETGLGDVRVGEGVAGLRQAFMLAGAESVLASLWKVPDRDTALLMAAYWDGPADRDRAEGLRQAQLKRIAERRAKSGAAHPYFWAAFTLTGR